ncbi:MAG: zinc-ribbon domain-containing protein [Lachnospiraceae bacterium]|nr:zinc-ribbon domain-containing protein [Lachnospiraceae bacterium]
MKNSLKTWCLNNGDFGQQLLNEWTGQCIDDNKQYTPDEVTKASGKRFRWQCSKESSHIWNATPNHRTNTKSGCPYCSGAKITDKNSLKTWCSKNPSHIWDATVIKRTSRKSGCPYCSRRKVANI